MNEKPTNLLRSLRALVPPRRLTYREAERIAELQANVFRERLGLTEPELPDSALTELPRLKVVRRHSLPVSGLTHWHNGRWLIVLNADEPEERQRFSLCHELKHVLDHTTQQWTCWDEAWRSGAIKAERLADYFSGCLLMPKRHVKRLFGLQPEVRSLADAFGVSTRAMGVRLSQLGLIGPTPRCRPAPSDWNHFGSPYFRQQSTTARVAA